MSEISTGQTNMSLDLIALGETMVGARRPPGTSLRDAATPARRSRRRREQHLRRPRAPRTPHRVGQPPRRRCGRRPHSRCARRGRCRHAMGAARSASPDRPDAEGPRRRRAATTAPDRRRARWGRPILDGVPIADARAVLVTGVTALIGPSPHAAGLALLDARTWSPDRRSKSARSGCGDPTGARSWCCRSSSAAICCSPESHELAEMLGRGRCGGATARRSARAAAAAARGPREVVVRGAASIGVLARRRVARRSTIRATPPSIRSAPATRSTPATSPSRLRGGAIDDALRPGVRCGAAVTTAVSDTAGVSAMADHAADRDRGRSLDRVSCDQPTERDRR